MKLLTFFAFLVTLILIAYGCDPFVSNRYNFHQLPSIESVKFIEILETKLEISDKYKFSFGSLKLKDEDAVKFMRLLQEAKISEPDHPTFIKKCDILIMANKQNKFELSLSPKGFSYYWMGGTYYTSKGLYDFMIKLEERVSPKAAIKADET